MRTIQLLCVYQWQRVNRTTLANQSVILLLLFSGKASYSALPNNVNNVAPLEGPAVL